MSTETVPRLSYTVSEAAKALGISKAKGYELVALGEIPSIKLGGRILVPRAALERLVAHLGEGVEDVHRTPSGSERLPLYRASGSRA